MIQRFRPSLNLLKKKLTILVYVLLCLIFIIVPTADSLHYADSTNITKTFVLLYLLVATLIPCFLIVLISKNDYILKISIIDASICTFLLLFLVGRLFLRSNPGFSIRLIDDQSLLALYVIFRFIPVKAFLIFFLCAIISGVYESVYGFLQITHFLPQFATSTLMGTFMNTGPYAGYLSIVACLSFGIYQYRNEIIQDIQDNKYFLQQSWGNAPSYLLPISYFIAITGLASTFIMLPATRSRAAWLAAFFSIAYIVAAKNSDKVIAFRDRLKRLDLSLKAGLIALLFCVSIIAFNYVYHFKHNSADGRFLIWKVSGNIIKKNLYSGVGRDKFKAYYMNEQAAYFSKPSNPGEIMIADNTYYAFNEVIQLFVENGVFTIVPLTMLILSCLMVKVEKNQTAYLKIALSIILTVFLFGVFSYPMQILPIKILLIFSLALLSSLDRRKLNFRFTASIEKFKRLFIVIKFSLVIAGIFFISRVFIYTQQLKTAYANWHTALTFYDLQNYERSIESFSKANLMLSLNGEFLMNYGQALALSGRIKQSQRVLERSQLFLNTTITETTLGDIYKKQNCYEKAEVAYLKASQMIPNRLYPIYLLAKLYKETGQQKKAIQKAQELLSKEIKVPSKAIKEMKSEMRTILKDNRMQSGYNALNTN